MNRFGQTACAMIYAQAFIALAGYGFWLLEMADAEIIGDPAMAQRGEGCLWTAGVMLLIAFCAAVYRPEWSPASAARSSRPTR